MVENTSTSKSKSTTTSTSTFTIEYYHRMREGIELFNEQKYWECHEVLEHLWIEEAPHPNRFVYWAVIQVAAFLIHYRDKNYEGALSLVKKAQEKFKKIDEFNLLPVGSVVTQSLDWQKLRSLVMNLPTDENKFKLELLEELFCFRFPKIKDE